ncbi:flagellar basal body P-ring protein FlgI, partial [Polaromonas sp. YR568]|uniref:flagellar basal body P-ring protein FlgI n=1 Tax=Polaromonas sp. YR568 TaxID=1855301 RepID=UPI00398BEDC5
MRTPKTSIPRHGHRRRGPLAAFAYLLKLCLLPPAVVMVAVLAVPHAKAERIKDLASIQGVRDNPLIGYGLMVGLDGSGDQTMQTPFTTQSLNNMLGQLGVTVPP